MPTQAIPLALLASLYPFGLAALLLLLSARRPRARAAVFFIGAAALLLVVGFLVVFVLRGAGVNKSSNQSTHYGLQLAIGLVFLLGAWVVAQRPPKPRSDQPSRVTNAVAGSGLLAVFLVGMAMYTPSPTYLAALEDVGASHLSSAEAAIWVVIVVALVLITIEIPILLYVFAPDWTIPKLKALDTWLSVNARTLLIGVLGVLGVWEVVAGIVGLV